MALPGLSFTSLKQQTSQALSLAQDTAVVASPIVSVTTGPGPAGSFGPVSAPATASGSPTATSTPVLGGDTLPSLTPSLSIPSVGPASYSGGLPAGGSIDPTVEAGLLGGLFKDPIVLLALGGAALLLFVGKK